jgi:hypothetical protein
MTHKDKYNNTEYTNATEHSTKSRLGKSLQASLIVFTIATLVLLVFK